MITKTPLTSPCMESTRCLLSSKAVGNARLSCTASGKISLSSKRQSCEEWTVVPSSAGLVVIQSLRSGRYLGSTPNGEVSSVPAIEANAKWRLETSPHGGVFVVSQAHENKLSCDALNGICLVVDKGGLSETWSIEFISGELCFLSSPLHDGRVRCDPLGNISMSENWKGWEVWRFIEAGDGNVYISSWTHAKYFLSSSADGHVFASKNQGIAEKWTISKAKSGDGVTIKSIAHGKSLGSDGQHLCTKDPGDKETDIWQLEAANKNAFYIASASYGKALGCRPSKANSPCALFTTNKRRGWEEWTLEATEDGSVSLKSNAHGMYIGINNNGEVTLSLSAGENEMWTIEECPYGGVFIVSEDQRLCLACDYAGNLKTLSGEAGESDAWYLEPCMPPTISGPLLGGLIGAGAVTVACAAAMPFVVTGVIAGAGFAGEGIVAGSMAAGMMSAEAAASGGGVMAGGLVATCQSIGAAGLGVAGTSAAIGGGALLGGSVSAATLAGLSLLNTEDASADDKDSIDRIRPSTKRPFCAWRSW